MILRKTPLKVYGNLTSDIFNYISTSFLMRKTLRFGKKKPSQDPAVVAHTGNNIWN